MLIGSAGRAKVTLKSEPKRSALELQITDAWKCMGHHSGEALPCVLRFRGAEIDLAPMYSRFLHSSVQLKFCLTMHMRGTWSSFRSGLKLGMALKQWFSLELERSPMLQQFKRTALLWELRRAGMSADASASAAC